MARQVPAVVRAFEILELFLDNEELSQPEIVAKLGLSRTTVHELVSTMIENGYLAPSPTSDRKVRLGQRTFELGSRYAERLNLAREGQSVAASVSARCQETVQVMVRDADHVIVIAKIDSTHSVRLVSAVGKRVPAHGTAGGKVLLAALSQDEFDHMFSNRPALEKMTANTITDVSALRAGLNQVKHDGIAWEYCESNDNVACVSAPVFDSEGSVVAAISISVPVVRWSSETKPQFAECVRKGASEMSRRLGYAGANHEGRIADEGLIRAIAG